MFEIFFSYFLIHLLQIHVLQIYLLQIHVLQIQSSPIQPLFYNMPTYGALNNKIKRRRIETVNLTEISVELDSSEPCGRPRSAEDATNAYDHCESGMKPG